MPRKTKSLLREALWEDDHIQFARLLAEIKAVGLTDSQSRDLCDSMDLPLESICELLDRAEEEWERLKGVHCPREVTP
jgi:hypothetical protein